MYITHDSVAYYPNLLGHMIHYCYIMIYVTQFTKTSHNLYFKNANVKINIQGTLTSNASCHRCLFHCINRVVLAYT